MVEPRPLTVEQLQFVHDFTRTISQIAQAPDSRISEMSDALQLARDFLRESLPTGQVSPVAFLAFDTGTDLDERRQIISCVTN